MVGKITNKDLQPYKTKEWVSVQKGNWSFLVCTDFIKCYTTEIEIDGANPFNHPMFICTPGKSELWFLKSELDIFGSRIKNINTDKKIKILCDNVKETGSELLNFIEKNTNTRFDGDLYKELWGRIRKYYKYHLIAKYLGDFISSNVLLENLNELKEARVRYAEPIGKNIYDLLNKIFLEVSVVTGIRSEMISCMTRDEIEEYFTSNIIPNISILEKRREFCYNRVEGWL